MRGNPAIMSPKAAGVGSIPAYAGEPGCGRGMLVDTGVYPRVCGGTDGGDGRTAMCGVYPRVCGGTRLRIAKADFPTGLSPRMRGNPNCRRLS